MALGTSAMATDADVLNPYKLYIIHSSQLAKIVESPLAELSGLKDYVWMVPLSDGSNRRVGKEGNAFKVLGARVASKTASHEDIDFAASFEKLPKQWKPTAANRKQIAAYAVEVADYATSFLIYATPEETYLFPFSDASHLTHLENGKRYTASEAMKILSASFPEGASARDLNANGGAASAASKTFVSPSAMQIGVISLMVMAAVIVIISLEEKKVTKSNKTKD